MKWYRVAVLAVTGSKNRIFEAEQEVNENQFHPGVAQRLCESGHLQLIRDDDEKPADIPSDQQPVIIEKEKELTIDDVTVKQIKADLSERGIQFKGNSSKQELFDLWSRR